MTPEREAKERELFEAYQIQRRGRKTYVSRIGDKYVNSVVRCDWDIWLARASIAAEIEAENVRLRTALEHVVSEIRGQMNSREYSFQDKVYWGQVAGVGEAALAPKGATE